MFRRKVGYTPNLHAPRTFNEKIAWRKVRQDFPLAPQVSDKLFVRDLVSQRAGDRYLKDVLAIYQPADEIDLSCLPPAFAMKASHTSGMNLFVQDKAQSDLKLIRRRTEHFLQVTDYGRYKNEWWYAKLPPRVFAEPLIFLPGQTGGLEYEVYVYDGVASVIAVIDDVLGERSVAHYDRSWEGPLPISRRRPPPPARPAPNNLTELLAAADAIGRDFDFVRVDFQAPSPDRLYFSELTLAPFAGWWPFTTMEADLFMGSFWTPRSPLAIDWEPRAS